MRTEVLFLSVPRLIEIAMVLCAGRGAFWSVPRFLSLRPTLKGEAYEKITLCFADHGDGDARYHSMRHGRWRDKPAARR